MFKKPSISNGRGVMTLLLQLEEIENPDSKILEGPHET